MAGQPSMECEYQRQQDPSQSAVATVALRQSVLSSREPVQTPFVPLGARPPLEARPHGAGDVLSLPDGQQEPAHPLGARSEVLLTQATRLRQSVGECGLAGIRLPGADHPRLPCLQDGSCGEGLGCVLGHVEVRQRQLQQEVDECTVLRAARNPASRRETVSKVGSRPICRQPHCRQLARHHVDHGLFDGDDVLFEVDTGAERRHGLLVEGGCEVAEGHLVAGGHVEARVPDGQQTETGDTRVGELRVGRV
mmetsp:Transcript_5677/g.16020  ORF Transcript_5677/g.16020 Transcript_5677/m.16020 type:complete len:251 (+) Transcript_5677:92-844(+)